MNKLTVIIPVYKTRSELLHACVDNVLLQAQPDLHIELILVDDGCPDTSGAECEAIARDYNGGTWLKVRVIHRANGGPSSARNEGLAAAGGDFITFVDSDDTVDPEIYGNAMRVFSEHPEADGVIFGFETITASGRELHSVTSQMLPLPAGEAFDTIAGDNFSCGGGYPWNKIFRVKSLMEAHGGSLPLFDSSLYAYEDKLWCLEALKGLRTVILMPETGYEYKNDEPSTSNGPEAVAGRQSNVYLAFHKMEETAGNSPRALKGLRVHLFKIVFTDMLRTRGGKAARTEMAGLLENLTLGDFDRLRDKAAWLAMRIMLCFIRL